MEEPGSGIVAVVLAAGGSVRLGRPKQLVELHGEPLVRRAARVALAAGASSVLVVLGGEVDGCRAALAGLPAQSLLVEQWCEGMGASLSAATRHLLATAEPSGIAVLLCDQYRVEAGHLRRLAAALRSGSKGIAAARDGAWLGPPAIFRPRWFSALALLEGERGARLLIGRHPEDVETVDLPGISDDLDVPEDLARMTGGAR